MSNPFNIFTRVVVLCTVAVLLVFDSSPVVVLGQTNNAGPKQRFDWPQFLGPDRNGISRETGLLKTWPAGGPKEIWRIKGGGGMSGLAIFHDVVFTLVQKTGKQWVVAYNARTGKLVWETALAAAYRNAMGDGPRATPAVFGDGVFTYTGEGILTALRRGNGAIVWSHNVVSELGGKPADYGMACSPLVIGDRVIVTVGAPEATVVAYHRTTGKLLWKAGAGDAAGYSSPALLTVAGRSQVVAFTGGALIGVTPDSGHLEWRYPYPTDYNCNITTPLSFKGQVFISSGENHGCVMLGFKRSKNQTSKSKTTVREIWKANGPGSVLRNEWQTSILLNGYLYGFDNVGSAGPVTHLTCVNAATGKRMWQRLRFGKGNLIAADGKLFISTMKGELVLVRATPNQYEELGRAKVIGSTRQAPALAAGHLYLRDGREMICLDVRNR